MFCKLAFLTALIGIGQSQLFPGIGSLPGAISKAAETASNAALSAADLAKVDNAWSSFKNTASYANPAELAKRKDIFTKNWQLVAQQASDFLAGKTSFQLRLNDFADLVLSEFNDFFNGYGKPPKRANAPAPAAAPPAAAGTLPQSVDWREKGAVSPVKHQNKCAGCYAFSATGALEGHNFRKNNVLVELSPQNLIDCTKSYSNLGCAGGYVDESFNYVKDHGINVYDKYPFEAKDGNCRFDSKSSAASAKGCVLLPEGDEKALAEAVATKGPVSVAIDARLPTMQLYGGGVYYDEKCKNSGDDLNHAVLVVGYGAEKDGTKYWLIKNSYGPKWGEDGYLKLAKDRNNHCGVATAAYYPVV